jgi:hypothetical protein
MTRSIKGMMRAMSGEAAGAYAEKRHVWARNGGVCERGGNNISRPYYAVGEAYADGVMEVKVMRALGMLYWERRHVECRGVHGKCRVGEGQAMRMRMRMRMHMCMHDR